MQLFAIIFFLIFIIIGIYIILLLNKKKALNFRLKFLNKVFENSHEGIIVTDAELKIIDVNQSFLNTSGYKPEEIIGQTPQILQSGWNDNKFYEEMWNSIKEKGNWQGEIWNRRRDGELYGQWLRIHSIKNKADKVLYYVGMSDEIKENTEAYERIHKLAYYDILTGLPNRVLFFDRLSQAITEIKRSNKMIALFFINFDNFKTINSKLGHYVGDKFLQFVSNILKSRLRETDTICRFGGDEFTVILKNISSSITSVYIAKKLIDALSANFVIDNHELHSTISIGIAIYPQDTHDINDLIQYANIAMNQAKQKGKNNFQLYQAEMNQQAVQRSLIENQLMQAIGKDELFLYYQPQIDIINNEIVGVEALIRWKNSDLGLVSPDRFISIAEETNLIIDLTDWVIETSCKKLAEIHKLGYPELRLAINISNNYLKLENITDHVFNIIKKLSLDPKFLEFEITERSFVDDIDKAVTILSDFKSKGISISVDDFGTGYSSMTYLRKLPIDRLKIDKSFIQHIPDNQNDVEIASAIIALAHALQLEVVAEGVETDEQLEFLKQKQCRYVQGYLFARPLNPDRLTGFFKKFREQYRRKKEKSHVLREIVNAVTK